MRLAELLTKAEAAGACEEALVALRECGSLRKARRHKQAPEWAYWYVMKVIGGRWPEGEDVIRRDAEWAYRYALEVIGGRWPEAEDVIRRDPYAYSYARDVLKRRWPEKEN